MSSRMMRKRLPLQDRTNAARNNSQPPQHDLSKKRVRSTAEDLIDDDENARSTRRRRPAVARKSLALDTSVTSPPSVQVATTKATRSTRSAGCRPGLQKSVAQGEPDKKKRRVSTDVFVLADSEQDTTLEQALRQDPDDELESSGDSEHGHMFSFTGTVLQATPLAAEMSARALKSFKRRPRQPSMLQMVRQRMASADVSEATLPAAPSYDFSDDIEDDFAPDLAGTPQRPTALQIAVPHRLSDALKLRESTTSSEPRATRSSQRHKQTRSRDGMSSEDQDSSQLTADFVTAHDVDLSHQQVEHAQPQVDETVITSTEDEVFLGSDSRDSVFADPVSQTTPPPPRGRRTRQKVKKIPSTADLQALLPRRRRAFSREPSAARSMQSLDSDEGSEEEQEVSYSITPRTKAVRTPAKSPGAALGRRHQRSDDNSAAQVRPLHQSKRHQIKNSRKARGKVAKEITSRRDRQQPQTDTADDDSSLAEDLAAAKKKFAQIDEWELDFENITPEENSSSSQAYR